jgi:hypothetical protein
MSCDPSRQRHHQSRLAGATIALIAAFGLAVAPSAYAQTSGGPGVANKFAVVDSVDWNGLRVSLWHVPGYRLYAYNITAPAALASGWRYCENAGAATVAACVGTEPLSAR